MSAILKYVNTPQGIVIFPMETQHDTFRALSPTSAGAVMLDISKGFVSAYGNSTSLNLVSVPDQDTEAIKKLLGMKP